MYRRVMVSLDGSPFAEAALAHLRQVAGADTDVLLLRVIDLGSEMRPIRVPTGPGVGMGRACKSGGCWWRSQGGAAAAAKW